MKRNGVCISYDEEKLSTLKLYLSQKGMQVEDELTKALDVIYDKNVPVSVRRYLNLLSGNEETSVPRTRRRKNEVNTNPDTEVIEDE